MGTLEEGIKHVEATPDNVGAALRLEAFNAWAELETARELAAVVGLPLGGSVQA